MKINYIVLITTTLFLITSSCDLDQKIFDAPVPENSMKTAQDVDMAVKGTYATLNSWFGIKELMRDITPYADDLNANVSWDPVGSFGRKSVLNSGFSPIYNAWYGMYRAISNANGVIYYVKDVNIDEQLKTQAISEAKFIRAFSYFHLVRIFGGVPLHVNFVEFGSDLYLPRSSVDDVYKLIFEDLTEASANLPLRSQQEITEFNRATKGAAQGILAKAYLTYANYLDLNSRLDESQVYYEKAKELTQAIIGSEEYELLSDYAKLWDVNNEVDAYKEVLFGVAYQRDPVTTNINSEGSMFALYFNPGTRPNSGGSTNVSNGIIVRGGSGAIKVAPWFYEKYTTDEYTGDYRSEVSFLTSWLQVDNKKKVTWPLIPQTGELTENQPYLNKYVDAQSPAGNSSENDFFSLRHSDIYLMLAEAENELSGPTAVALNAFNMVRSRARKANGTVRATPQDLVLASVPTKEELRLKIFDERGLEFIGELNRWFDLIRMRYKDNVRTMYEYQFGEFLPALVSGFPTYNSGTKKWSSGRTDPSNVIPYDSKYLLWPIPANEMGVNTKLVQNPGW